MTDLQTVSEDSGASDADVLVPDDTPAPRVVTRADIARQLDTLIVAVATWPSDLSVLHAHALARHLAHARRIIGH